MSFEIVTDSSCNLNYEQIEKNNIHVIPLYYIVNGEERLSNSCEDESVLKEYFNLMRKKVPMSTSCTTREICLNIFEDILAAGKDLIYIGMSSALSTNFNVVSQTLNELKANYPKAKVFCVDTLSASLGQGLLVIKIAELRDEGASICKAYDFAEDNKLKICHLYTVDTLAYLYRGGRVTRSARLLADTLNIKPIMSCDNSGSLCAVGKVFGRKGSINSIAKRLAESIVNPESQTIYIGHGDCIEDAEHLAMLIKEKVTVKDIVINYIDLVVGVHGGPGTIAVFYMGSCRI